MKCFTVCDVSVLCWCLLLLSSTHCAGYNGQDKFPCGDNKACLTVSYLSQTDRVWTLRNSPLLFQIRSGSPLISECWTLEKYCHPVVVLKIVSLMWDIKSCNYIILKWCCMWFGFMFESCLNLWCKPLCFMTCPAVFVSSLWPSLIRGLPVEEPHRVDKVSHLYVLKRVKGVLWRGI